MQPIVLELRESWLRVPLGDDAESDFHFRFLRHNCPCDRHPLTGERTLCSSDIADWIRPALAQMVDGDLEIIWPDGHMSNYPRAWLREHAYAVGAPEVPRIPADPARLEIQAAGRSLADQVAAALERVEREGAAIVRRDPGSSVAPEDATEAIIEAFAAAGLAIVPTHFGRLEDLRTDNTTNANTDQLGYTDAPVDLHTDQPFIAAPPRLQLLHSIRAADRGGESVLADARSIFRYLEASDRRVAEVLASVPVRFHRRQRAFESVVDSPLIADTSEREFMIRASYFTLAPHRVDFAAMAELYRAHDRFFRLARDPRNHYETLLRPGDWLLYNNHRMLHARTGFKGPRWVRGIYFERQDPAGAARAG